MYEMLTYTLCPIFIAQEILLITTKTYHLPGIRSAASQTWLASRQNAIQAYHRLWALKVNPFCTRRRG